MSRGHFIITPPSNTPYPHSPYQHALTPLIHPPYRLTPPYPLTLPPQVCYTGACPVDALSSLPIHTHPILPPYQHALTPLSTHPIHPPYPPTLFPHTINSTHLIPSGVLHRGMSRGRRRLPGLHRPKGLHIAPTLEVHPSSSSIIITILTYTITPSCNPP